MDRHSKADLQYGKYTTTTSSGTSGRSSHTVASFTVDS